MSDNFNPHQNPHKQQTLYDRLGQGTHRRYDSSKQAGQNVYKLRYEDSDFSFKNQVREDVQEMSG